MIDANTEKLRHSAAHVLAMAIMRIYPDAKLGIGPVTDQGFYYDFELPQHLEWSDVKQIEGEMNLIIQENLPFTQLIVPRDQAYNILLTRGQMYKAELLEGINDPEVSFFKTGEEFIDLCRGPHLNRTGDIGVIKLQQITESFWQNDNNRPQLQRISGVAFNDLDELKRFLQNDEEIKNRDFRRLAQLMKLSIGAMDASTYTPEGTQVINIIQNAFLDRILSSGYNQIIVQGNNSLNALNIGFDEFFSSKQRSYKELPIKVFGRKSLELSEVHRIAGKEVRGINCIKTKSYFSASLLKTEGNAIIEPVVETLRQMNITPFVEVVVPNLEMPELQILTEILVQSKLPQTQLVDPLLKQNQIIIRFCTEDNLHRTWQLAEVVYVRESGLEYNNKQGTLAATHTLSCDFIAENLIAYFLENEAGALPIWLSPIQTVIIPISENQHYYSKEVNKMLQNNGIRSKLELSSDTMKAKIRDAELDKIPAVIIIGEKETNNNSVSLRLRDGKEVGLISLDQLLDTLQQL